MSAEFIAYLNDQEYGPVSYSDLEAMWRSGEVSDVTNVRFSDQSKWMTWKELRAQEMEELARRAREQMQNAPPKARTVYLPGAREKLRELTGYPVFRGCIIVMLVVSIAGFLISGWALTYDDYRTLGIAGMISSLGSIFSTLILGVLLDIADALLAKLD